MQNSRSLFCAPFFVAPDNNNNNSNNIHSSYRKNNVTKKTAVAASKPTSCFELNRILLSIDFFPSLSEHSIFLFFYVTKHFHWGLMVHCMLYVVKESGCRKKKWRKLNLWERDARYSGKTYGCESTIMSHSTYVIKGRVVCSSLLLLFFFCNVALAVPSHRHIVWYFLVCRRFTFFFFPVCSFCMTLLHSPPLLSLT